MDIGSIFFDKGITNSARGVKSAQEMAGASFFDHLSAAQGNANKPLPSSAPQQPLRVCVPQAMQASQVVSQAGGAQPSKEPQMSFPPGFPEDMKRQLTDFMDNSNLSSAEKDAMWATTVVSLDLMNNGPAGFRRYLTEESRFDSPSFNAMNLIARYGNALATKGYPNIGKAVQEYLQKAG